MTLDTLRRVLQYHVRTRPYLDGPAAGTCTCARSELLFGVCVEVDMLLAPEGRQNPGRLPDSWPPTGLNARAMMSVAMYSIRATLRSDCVRSARKAPGARGSFGSPPGSPPRPVRTRAQRRGDEARRLARWPWQLHAIGEDALVSSSGAGGGEWWFEFSSWCKSCKKGCGSPPRVGRGAL